MKSSYFSWLKKICSLTFFCTFAFAGAQETPNKIALKEIIPQLEKTFEIRFSYRESDIEGVIVKKPPGGFDLQETLNFLEEQTSLKFKILDERYIAIIGALQKINLCGTVKDRKTLVPLVGATIQTTDSLSTAITDLDGNFVLKNVDRDSYLHIRYLGYQELLEPTSGMEKNCLEIYLDPVFESLEETVVVNYLTSGISKRIDGSTHINTERFGTLPGLIEPDVLQTVESLPGVESVNETISNINIRGGTSDQNLVLFDGIKMYLTGHFFGLISAFNPNLTKEVDVVKNGSNASLSDGTSGTIEIKSKNELTHDFSGGAGFNLVSADAFFQVPVTEKLELHFSGRRSINDLVNTPTYDNYFSRTFQDTEVSLEKTKKTLKTADFSYYDTSFKALYDFSEEHRFRFTLITINNELEYTESSNTSEEQKKSRLAQNNLALGGTWTSNWGENFKTQTSSYLTRYQLDAMNYTVDTDQELLQKNEVLETGLKFNTTLSLNKTTDFLNGYQFYEVGVSNREELNNPVFRRNIKKVIRNHSLYSEIKYSGSKTYIRGGVRFNYLSKFNELLIEPRITWNQKLTSKIAFKAQAELKSQTTSQIIDLQEDFLGVENRRWIIADYEEEGNIYPVIKSKQLSSGFDYKAKGWYIDLEAFYKIVEGIHTSNQGFQDQNEFIRTSGSYTAKGVELLINKKAGPFHTYINYTFGQNDYSFEELTPNNFPNNFDIRHSASLAANYSYRELKFSLGGHLRSGKPYTKPIEGNEIRKDGNDYVINYAAPNAETLPSFFRADFSSSYNFRISEKGNATISLGLLNILNRNNVINRYYRVDSKNPKKAVQINNASLGFTPNALFRISF